MNDKERELFKFLLSRYKKQWDENGYNRTEYDEDLEYYQGYRDTSDYPLSFNESFNRILPIIYTILSRFMDQLYQGGNIVSVKPRKRKDLYNAKAIEGVLNFQLETLNDFDQSGGSYLTMMRWFFNAITFGKGLLKMYWRKEDRISPKRIAVPIPNFDSFGNFQGFDIADKVSQEMQTIYNGPYAEVIHNKLFIPDIRYKSIQQMPFCFLVYKKSIDDVYRKFKEGIYQNFDELGFTGSTYASDGYAYASSVNQLDSDEAFVKSLGIEGALTFDQVNDTIKSPEVDILECYGKMILEDEPYEVGSGYSIKGPEEEAIIHIGNWHTILSVQRNIYNIRPIFDIGCYMQPELFWDIGLVRLTKGIQNQINNLANLRMQNVFMLVNQMLRVDPQSDIPPESLVWKPFGIIPAIQGEVEPIDVPDMQSHLFMEQQEFYEHTIQDLMGMYDYNMGATPQRQERVGVVYGIQAMGEARAKLLLMSMDYLGIRPLLKYMMILNSFHLPSGFEYRITNADQTQFGNIFGGDIHPEFDYAARYTSMEPALGKQFRAQQLIQMAQLWVQSPWINQFQFNKTLMELLDIQEAELLLKSPQELQQEAMSQQQSAMMAEVMKNRYETEGKLALSAADTKGQIAVEDRRILGDLALAAIDQETKLAQIKEQKKANEKSR